MAVKRFEYEPQNVCSKRIAFEIKDGLLASVEFEKGCSGNLQGISRLVEGLPVDAVIGKLRGINCSGKGTSCPDQLARALEACYKP